MHTTANGNGTVYNLLDKADSIVIANKATLYYYYHAAGATLRKQVNDYSHGATIMKNYLYIDGFVYLNDTLQYVSEEEGRIRWAQKRNNSNGTIYYAFEYDYYLRDHLNNVRTVLTEGKDTATYAATMETANSAMVQKLFSNVYDPVRTVAAKPAAFDSDPNNHFVSKLTGSTGGRIGPSIILKVMAGDKVQINTYAYYNGTVQTPVSDNTLLTDLLSTLVSGITNQSGGKIGGGNSTALSNVVSPNVLSFLNSRTYSASLPKAYLNWVLLDNQFKFVAGNMGAKQVTAGSSKQALVAPLQTIAKNGYLYVYLSNQSPQDVFFDDLIVTHTTGPLLQEQSYYPFGLQMAGISDKAILKPDSKNKFNGGVELEEDYGVNLYSTFYRNYDPQIGRFGGVDVLSERSISVNSYQFGINNPVSFNDPWGDKNTLPTLEDIIDRLWDSKFGGSWSSSSAGYLFEFGDRQTATFFGSIACDGGGGGGSTYMSNLASAYSFIQNQSAAGNEIVNFEISQGRNKEYFATSAYYSPADAMNGATMLKDLGQLGPGLNGLSYSWGNIRSENGLAINNYYSKEKNNDWEHLSESVVIGADSHVSMTNLANVLSKDAGMALKGLAKTGTVIGAIAGAAPAFYNLTQGDFQWNRDGVALGIATLGIISEFSGLGEIWDGSVGLMIAGGSLVYDVYDINNN